MFGSVFGASQETHPGRGGAGNTAGAPPGRPRGSIADAGTAPGRPWGAVEGAGNGPGTSRGMVLLGVQETLPGNPQGRPGGVSGTSRASRGGVPGVSGDVPGLIKQSQLRDLSPNCLIRHQIKQLSSSC